MITAGATPTPKTIDQRRVALTSPQVKTLQTDNAGTLGTVVVQNHQQDPPTSSNSLMTMPPVIGLQEEVPRRPHQCATARHLTNAAGKSHACQQVSRLVQ